MAASSRLELDTTDAAATEPDLSAGRDVAAAHAVTGSDFPWLQPLIPGRESLCRAPGNVCLRPADPARYAAPFATAGCGRKCHLVCRR